MNIKLENYIDHTMLKPEAGVSDILRVCDEALKWKFKAVCINPFWIKTVKKYLEGTGIKIASVVGFPLGACSIEMKIMEIEKALKEGADEIDMVMNIGMFKDGEYSFILNEIKKAKHAVRDKTLKVIVETCLLNEQEKKDVCSILLEAGADYIKTSTGFSSKGAVLEDVILFKEICNDKMLIKASGGIRDRDSALKFIEAGAGRIGTSNSVKIMEE